MRIERVVVGVDFSEHSLDTARWVTRHVTPHASFTLVTAVDLPATPSYIGPASGYDAVVKRSDALARAEDAIVATARELAPARITTRVRVGAPYDVLLESAREVGANLVVLGRHGAHSGGSRLLGTTADRVARLSPVPVLVYAGTPTAAPQRVLVAVDDCEVAVSAMRWGAALSTAADGEVVLLHVLSEAAYGHLLSASAARAHSEQEVQEDVRDELQAVAQHWLDDLARAHVVHPRVSAHVAHGAAAQAILDAAGRMEVDLIVIGRHGSGHARLLLGGTARRVLHDQRFSTLIVPPE